MLRRGGGKLDPKWKLVSRDLHVTCIGACEGISYHTLTEPSQCKMLPSVIHFEIENKNLLDVTYLLIIICIITLPESLHHGLAMILCAFYQ